LYPGAPTVDLLSFRIDSMKITTPTRKRSRTVGLLLYALALSLVLLAPVLGAMALAVAVWQALVAGSIWYMPLGLVLVLATIGLVQSHKPFDLALLGLVVAAVIAWFWSDLLPQGRLLDGLQALVPQTGLMVGALVVMVVALILIHTTRRTGRF
jgi:hypothetical protein